MTTKTITVRANSIEYGDRTRDIEIELVENEAGKVIVTDEGGVYVDANPGPSLGSKVCETVLRLRPVADGGLVGSVTPIGKREKVRGGFGAEQVRGDANLSSLHAAARKVIDAQEAVRNELWAEGRAAKEARIALQIPAGYVTLRSVGSEADGWVQLYDDGRGHVLRSPKIAGESGYTAWMSPEDHAAAVAECEGRREAEAERTRAIAAEKVATESAPVPAAALAAYRRYEGSTEAAWDAEDEAASVAIERHGDAIEAQGLATPGRRATAEYERTARAEAGAARCE